LVLLEKFMQIVVLSAGEIARLIGWKVVELDLPEGNAF